MAAKYLCEHPDYIRPVEVLVGFDAIGNLYWEAYAETHRHYGATAEVFLDILNDLGVDGRKWSDSVKALANYTFIGFAEFGTTRLPIGD
jgi:hypothetical protein